MKCAFKTSSCIPTPSLCRLCLKVDIKTYKLNNTPHTELIESILKLKGFKYVPSEDHYVCYICMALLTKTSNFIQMIGNAQKLFYDLLTSADTLTKPVLQNIDRLGNGIDLISLSSTKCIIIDSHDSVFMTRDNVQDSNLITFKEKNLGIFNKRETLEKTKQVQESKMTKHINETDNSFIAVISRSDENIEEKAVDECFLNDTAIEISDPLEVDKKLLHTLDMDECDVFTATLQESYVKTYKSESNILSESERDTLSESEISSEKERQRKKYNNDYQPESTSYSENSNFDSYDDSGKRIQRPKDADREYPRKCDHCCYEVPKKSDHYRHYLFMHPTIKYPYAIERSYACSICGKLNTKISIGQHEKNHSNKEIKCTICPKIFSSARKMTRHRLQVHPKSTFTCDYCSKVCKTRSVIVLHLRTHTGEKPFKCHICGAGFAHSGNRTIHIRSKHQNIRYVPRKQTNKKRKKPRYGFTDTEIEPSDEQNQRKIINAKKKHKSKTGDRPDADMVMENKNLLQKRSNNKKSGHCKKDDHIGAEVRPHDKKVRNSGKGGNTDAKTESNQSQQKKNTRKIYNSKRVYNTEVKIESDDENLAQIKERAQNIKLELVCCTHTKLESVDENLSPTKNEIAQQESDDESLAQMKINKSL